MLGIDRLDAGQAHAAAGEQIPGGHLDDVDAAQLPDVPPAGDDRPHLGGAALHHARRQRREQGARQRRAETEHACQHHGGGCAVPGADQRDQHGRQRTGAGQPGKLLLVFVAGAGSGAVRQEPTQDLRGPVDQHIRAVLAQAAGNGPQRAGVLEAVGYRVIHLGADQAEVIFHRARVHSLTGGIQAKHQHRRTGQQRNIPGIILCGQQDDTLDGRAQQRQHREAVRRRTAHQPHHAGEEGAPAHAACRQQQDQGHRRVNVRVRQRPRQDRQRRRHQAQRQQNQRDGPRDENRRRLIQDLAADIPAHRRGILRPLIVMAARRREFRRSKGTLRGVLSLIRRAPAQTQAAHLEPSAPVICLFFRLVLQRLGQPGRRRLKAVLPGSPARVDGLGDVFDKGRRTGLLRGALRKILRKAGLRRRAAAQILGKAAMRRGLRRNAQVLREAGMPGGRLRSPAQLLGKPAVRRFHRRQTDPPRQRIHQVIHFVGFPVRKQALLRRQPHHPRIGVGVAAGRGRLAFLLPYLRGSRLGGRFFRFPGGRTGRTHRIVGRHKILRTVQGRRVRRAQLHRKARMDRRTLRQADRLPHRLPGRGFGHRLGRGRGAHLLAGRKFNGIPLFAVDGPRRPQRAGQGVGILHGGAPGISGL